MAYFNVHSHIFTMNNAPERFLHLYLPGPVADAIDKITDTDIGERLMKHLLSIFGGSAGKRYASFLGIGKSAHSVDVFETLKGQYSESDMIFTALTMYMEDFGAGKSLSGFDGQIQEAIEVKRRFPDHLLLFMGIDPRWQATGQALRKKVEAYFDTKINVSGIRTVYPFAGLKLYPSTGFYVFDERLKPTLEWAADNGVPIMSHCNYVGGIYNNDKDYLSKNLCIVNPYSGALYPGKYQEAFKLGSWLLGGNRARNNKSSCSFFLEPASYKDMLRQFKIACEQLQKYNFKLCLAHYGGDSQIIDSMNPGGPKLKPVGVARENWSLQIKDLIREFPNVYTDVSYALHNPKIVGPILNDLKDPNLVNRIMFGTDFFLTEQEMPEKQDYTTFRDKMKKEFAGTNTAWDQIAVINPGNFLKSKYYP